MLRFSSFDFVLLLRQWLQAWLAGVWAGVPGAGASDQCVLRRFSTNGTQYVKRQTSQIPFPGRLVRLKVTSLNIPPLVIAGCFEGDTASRES